MDSTATAQQEYIRTSHAMVQSQSDTLVASATDSCAALTSNVVLLENLATKSQTTVTSATNMARTTNNQLTRLLADLENIDQLDATEISDLGTKVQAAQADLNARDLHQIVQDLQALATQQRTRLTQMQVSTALMLYNISQ